MSNGASGPNEVKRFDEPTARYAEPVLLRSADQIPIAVNLPSLDDAANNRIWHRGLRTERAFARKVTFPPNGGTPIHGVTCDHVIIQLEGTIDFDMRGQIFSLNPGDMLYFPANALYQIHNRSSEDAALISVGIEAEFGWPPRSEYWSEPHEPEQPS